MENEGNNVEKVEKHKTKEKDLPEKVKKLFNL